MFERYVKHNSEFVDIPLPKGKQKLMINESGQILSLSNGFLPIGYDNDGNKVVKVDLWNGLKEYKVSLIVLITFGKLKLQTTYYHLVEPFHIDGNKNNLHPSNLGYRYTHPIECEVMPGFYYIPFFNRYVISKKGEVYHWTSGRLVRPYTFNLGNNPKNIKGGYKFFNIYADTGTFVIGRYRALCLTFKEYPDNVDKLIVNHIDMDPTNDELDNLEWATRSWNNIHAAENGARSQNIWCYGKNTITGEERSFFSLAEAKRQTGVMTTTISNKLQSNSQDMCTDGWIFKTDVKTPWRVVEDPHKELKSISTPTLVRSKNIFTGEIRDHASIAQIGIDLGLESVQAPKTQILKGYNRPYCGYLFKLSNDTTPWPEYNERELAVFRDNPTGHARGVIARNEKGEELFFTNITNASLHFKHILNSKNDVIKAIARKRNVDGYQLHYL